MRPIHHANISAKKYGGVAEDYLDIHEFLDSSGATHGNVTHRALLHHAFGCTIVEKVFGLLRANSAGRKYSPYVIAQEHIYQDLGYIPSVSDYLNNMQLQPWMAGNKKYERRKKFIPFGETDE